MPPLPRRAQDPLGGRMKLHFMWVMVVSAFLLGVSVGWHASTPIRRQVAITLETLRAARSAVKACESMLPTPLRTVDTWPSLGPDDGPCTQPYRKVEQEWEPVPSSKMKTLHYQARKRHRDSQPQK